MRIVVSTPTGRVGAAVVEALFRQGYAPSVIHRDPVRVEPLVRRGARLVRGSLADPGTLAAACRGADMLFWVTPTDPTQPSLNGQQMRLADALARALPAIGPIRVVNLSGIGARHDCGVGPVRGLHAIEQVFNAALRDVTHLRAAWFFENFAGQTPLLRKGRVSLPVAGGSSVPMVATRDVAAVACRLLLDRGWAGVRAVGVDGPENLTFHEAAAAIGRGLGRRIEFDTAPAAAARAAFRALGFHFESAGDLLELYAAISTGKLRFDEPTIQRAPHPTSLETFARETLKPLLKT